MIVVVEGVAAKRWREKLRNAKGNVTVARQQNFSINNFSITNYKQIIYFFVIPVKALALSGTYI